MGIHDLLLNYTFSYLFKTSSFPFDDQNGSGFSKCSGKDNEFEYHFLIICRYFEPSKKSEDNIMSVRKITNSCNTKSLNRWWKNMLFSLKYAWKGTLLPTLRANSSCRTDNFRRKVGNVQMVYLYYRQQTSNKNDKWNSKC